MKQALVASHAERQRRIESGELTVVGVNAYAEHEPSPLIAGDDIISYDLSTHAMKLQREALARIPNPPVDGTPFIVVAQGQRVYLGVFITITSSHSFAVPVIDAHPQALNPSHPADTLVIERAYPSKSFGVGPDPRGDERIKTALIALGKSKGATARLPRDVERE